jgi:hypothetical protein
MVTPEMLASMVAMLEQGMSIEGVANVHGMSDETLKHRRHEDPELDAAILCARAKYEFFLTQYIAERPGTQEATAAAKERAQQFPFRHGLHTARRLHNESRMEDVPATTQASVFDPTLIEAVAAVLSMKKAGAV